MLSTNLKYIISFLFMNFKNYTADSVLVNSSSIQLCASGACILVPGLLSMIFTMYSLLVSRA